jgi:hypothetical protein
MRNWVMSAVAVGALLAVSPALAQDVHVDSNASASFAGYRTYDWRDGTPSSNPLSEQRIRAAVDQQMAAKGFTRVTVDPDVIVATHVVTKEKQKLSVNNYGGFGYGYGYFGGPIGGTIDTYTVGTLAVDLYDTKSTTLVWRGSASATVSDKPEKNAAKISKAITKMFRQYPPSPGSK